MSENNPSNSNERRVPAPHSDDYWDSDEANAYADGSDIWDMGPHEPGEIRPLWAVPLADRDRTFEERNPSEIQEGQPPKQSPLPTPEVQQPDQEPPHQA